MKHLILLLFISSICTAEDAKEYLGYYYGNETFTPCDSYASHIAGDLKAISKVDSFKARKSPKAPVFIQFKGYKIDSNENPKFDYTYIIEELVSLQASETPSISCKELNH